MSRLIRDIHHRIPKLGRSNIDRDSARPAACQIACETNFELWHATENPEPTHRRTRLPRKSCRVSCRELPGRSASFGFAVPLCAYDGYEMATE